MITPMEFGVGHRIREERLRLGWDQAELARRLGDVGQQTVSRWERGVSRPRRNMVGRLAELFEVDPNALLTAAGYVAATADRPDQASGPVRPRLTVLPLADLTPDKFEELVTDLAHHLYPGADASRFGGQGHRQDGIDVLVQEGSRRLATFQCKRHKQFGPQQVRDAVTALTVDAEHHFLVLSRGAASPECRKEMANHERWTLWDAEDVSRVVRTDLELDVAVRLVDTYFPGWREPLLGVPEPGPWLQTDEFFRPLGGAIYTHDWQMVGRTKELSSVAAFLEEAKDRLGLVVGRGGIGKTRFLRAVASAAEHRSVAVRFLTIGADLAPEHLELLPSRCRLLVVLDDAHDRGDIATALVAITRLRPDAQVLLALRPYGLGPLTSELRRLGLHPSEVPTWELSDLADEDAEALARQALGPGWPDLLVRRLGRLTADCPLITVVGGVLIRRGQLDPACLDHEETIRTEILRAFRDALVADPLSGDSEVRRAVLDALAALQPFRSDDPGFQKALAALVGLPFDRAISHIRGLEDAGVLLRRGSSLRIVPDLLGDVILTDVCFDGPSGTSTGFIERACEAAEGQPLQHVFVNSTRIDWQLRHDHANAPQLTTVLWHAVEAELRSAGIVGRQHLLQLLRKVAYFAPQQTLKIVRWIIDHPTDTVEEIDHFAIRLYPPSYDDVLHELPPLLRAAAYNLDQLPTAVNTLWELAQLDHRPTNQFPEHALRVLRDLAQFELGKPLAYNHALIDAAERWLASTDVAGSIHSPFDVLEPMLATEGTDDSVRGFQIVFKPFALEPSSVAPLRTRVVQLALRETKSQDVRRAVRAMDALEAALHYPAGLFGREIADSERDKWTPEFLDIIGAVGDAVESAVDPVVAVAARKALHWHADYSPTATRAAAQRVRTALPTSPEHQLAFMLFDGWGHLSDERPRDYRKAEADKQARMQDLAGSLLARHPDDDLADLLVRRLTNQQSAFGSTAGRPGQFIWTLVAQRPSLGLEVCDRVAADPTSVLLQVLPVVVAALAEHAPNSSIAAVETLLQLGDIGVRQQVAQALGWNRGPRTSLLDGELDVLSTLARDRDEYVRTCVVRAAQRLAPDNPVEAMTLVGHVPFSDSARVAEEVFETFGEQGGLHWHQLPQERGEEMLAQLRDCPSIENHYISSFLAALSKDEPTVVVRLLQDRVEAWEKDDSPDDYRALPYHWDHQLHVRDHPEILRILREVLRWIAAAPNSWQRQHAGGELFKAVAGSFDEAVMSVLEDAIATGDPDQMAAVAAVLRQAPQSLVYDNVAFVRHALGAAARLGEAHAQRIGGALHAAVTSGVRTGTPGQPFSHDIQQRDTARKIAERLPRGSIEERFYRSLQESAEHSIRWSTERDERLVDGRDW